VRAPETTGKFVAATFEHDTARPVEGYAAPQLHTHAVIFNVTERDIEAQNGIKNGKQTRALQPQELFASQRYATSVYRSELAVRLEKLGYTLERGKHGQPEIKGYTKEYLEASSPRREQIKDHLRESGINGAGAAQAARQAVTYARDHVFERSAVEGRRDILEAALNRGMGQTTIAQVRQEFERRVQTGEFVAVEHLGAGQQYTTATMLRMEREIIGHMQEGNRRGYNDPTLVPAHIRVETEDRQRELNAGQRQAVEEVFLSREKIIGLDGIAGAGKTTTLAVVREGAESAGYKVEGFAPTSRAAQTLGDAGIESMTLQMHLVRGQRGDTGEHWLYVLDESSLASTRQMHEFIERLHPNDRVLLVGDTRQHESVEAGRIFAQLQDAGMKTVKLERSCARRTRS
jgi:ATP-dependent exoDNAse (exonuclease V) alpha subunit